MKERKEEERRNKEEEEWIELKERRETGIYIQRERTDKRGESGSEALLTKGRGKKETSKEWKEQ